jgi:predicted alpha/beta-fold hydrolase
MHLEPLEPPIWAPTAHAQTILGHLLPSPRLRSKGKRAEIPVSGGDRLVAFAEEGESNTVVYIFHGLAGSTDSAYIHRTAILALKQGHTVVLVNHHGCGEGAGLAREPYHSGRAEDLAAAIAWGRARFPRRRHVAVGFSLSANALLLLLSGRRGEGPPDAAIAVNAPIHLQRCSELLGRGLNRIYDIKFYLQCRRDVMAADIDPAVKARLPRLTSLYRFDSLYTAPAGGFASREHYYESCSTYGLLGSIRTPTFVLTSKDDPFVPFASYADACPSSCVQLHAEENGGHMGYLSRRRTPLGSIRWQDYALDRILRQI